MKELIEQAKENLEIIPEKSKDVFLILCSFNFLNAMVKKKENKDFIHYGFLKPAVSRFVSLLIDRPELVTDFCINPKEKCVYIRCLGLQFSFHNIEPTNKLKRFEESTRNHIVPWDGIRLQSVAEELYQLAVKFYFDEIDYSEIQAFVVGLQKKF